MKSNQPLIAAAILFSLAISSTNTFAQDDQPQLGKFRDILRKGQAIYLRASQNNPYFTVQLLTDEQAESIRKEQKQTLADRKKLEQVADQIKKEKSLKGRAKLLLEQDRLESEITRALQRSRFTSATYYEVQWVAGDYMALKRDGVEKYVPFRSVTSIEKRDTLPTVRRSFGRSSSYRGAPTPVQNHVRLKNLKAKDVVVVINELFADSKFELKVNEEANLLTVTAISPLSRQIESLIERLDVSPSE